MHSGTRPVFIRLTMPTAAEDLKHLASGSPVYLNASEIISFCPEEVNGQWFTSVITHGYKDEWDVMEPPGEVAALLKAAGAVVCASPGAAVVCVAPKEGGADATD